MLCVEMYILSCLLLVFDLAERKKEKVKIDIGLYFL